jgi:hypothetical protein
MCVLDITGESHYRDGFVKICGEPKEAGEDYYGLAVLVPEPDNAYDRSAVRVDIIVSEDATKTFCETVGHLSRDSAMIYRAKYGTTMWKCGAHITAGWSRDDGEDRGDYCVRLAFDLAGEQGQA